MNCITKTLWFFIIFLNTAKATNIKQFEKINTKQDIHVTFINPGTPSDIFWIMTIDFMRAAAKDLGIELEVIDTEGNHIEMVKIAKNIAQRETKPDYLLIAGKKSNTEKLISIANQSNIKVLLLINGLTPEQTSTRNISRSKYKSWIGTIEANNKMASYNLTDKVLDKIQEKSNEKIEIIALSNGNTTSSIDKEAGLKRAVRAHSGSVLLNQTLYCDDEEDAYTRTKGLLLRYPNTKVIWAAKSNVLMGALRAAKDANKILGNDIHIVGFELTEPALDALKNGEIDYLTGYHFTMGAWALVLILDSYNELNFKDDEVLNKIPFEMKLIDANNAVKYLNKTDRTNFSKINFKKFSKIFGSRSTYNFNIIYE